MVFGASALLVAGTYACSSDNNNGTTNGNDAGADTGAINADTGTQTTDDGSTGNTDSGADGGDSGSIDLSGCNGNPLVADGGTPDASLDASSAAAVGSGTYLYGPLWVDDNGGGVIYSELYNQRIDRTDGNGGPPFVVAPTGDVNALPIQNATNGGFVFTAVADQNGDGGAIMKSQPDGGGTPTFTRIPVTDGGVVGISGVAIHSKGILFFTDPQFLNSGIPAPGIYSMPLAGGAVTTIAAFTSTDNDRPVGIAFNKDQTALYVSHYAEGIGQTGHLTKYTVDANGVASNPTTLPFAPTGRPLGIAVDAGGNIWIAEEVGATGTNGQVEVIDPTGTNRWATIAFPGVHATGVAFGGTDHKKVFITSENNTSPGTLYSLPTRCPGF